MSKVEHTVENRDTNGDLGGLRHVTVEAQRVAPVSPSTSNTISRCDVCSAMARRKSPSVLFWIGSISVILSSVIGVSLVVIASRNSTVPKTLDDHLLGVGRPARRRIGPGPGRKPSTLLNPQPGPAPIRQRRFFHHAAGRYPAKNAAPAVWRFRRRRTSSGGRPASEMHTNALMSSVTESHVDSR